MATSQSNNTTSTIGTKDNPTTLSTVTVVSKSKSPQEQEANSPSNIASLLNPSTLDTLKSIKDPKAFGDQARDLAKQQITKAITESTLARLLRTKAELIKEGIELAKECIKSSTQRDVGSGKGIDVFAITKDGIKHVVAEEIVPQYKQS